MSESNSEQDRDLRSRAIEAYDSALDSASAAGRRAGDSIGGAPLVALGAGVGRGAGIAPLRPAGRREADHISP
jgi:hypothetical protein